ncbi:excitatory amino acid transporter 1-like protein [Dermatophagoides farinae]|uniref:Amino acid transporter n=1 Tax=Dermatophagoides farinae TaxID=6954 RepID=A0A9D4P8R3_DERFA|nr:excitatory amino acid transporter 3-like [Dermatophagoides farinae]KAH7645619.1 excitatory amino acid transporter 1-like protein [Dermatophagoides farinae]
MFGTKLRELIRTNKHSLTTIIAIIFGLSLGFVFRNHVWPDEHSIDKQKIRYLELPGLIFLRSFQLLLAPVLITSLTTSFFCDKIDNNESNDFQQRPGTKYDLQKVTAMSFLFFISFSIFTAILGITAVSILEPGSSTIETESLLETLNNTNYDPIKQKQEKFRKSHYQMDSVYNIILNIFPDNPLTPFFMKSYEQTEFIWPQHFSEINDPNFVPKNKIKTLYSFDPNMLGICVLSISLGFILSKLPSYKTENIRALLNELDVVVKCLLDIMIRIMPIGMFCWMFTESLKMKSLNKMVSQLFYFYLIAICLFLFIWFIFYPTIHFVITRNNPYRIHRGVFSSLLVAAASCSSALALPVTMECMENHLKLPKIISKMVLPLGMTIHMNGSSMYYPMVAVFISQVKQVPQNFLTLSILCVFSLVMSMGFPGVPAGGTTLVSHLAFASVLGIDNPQEIIILVLTFDWIFERLRTITNVMGDCFVAKCLEKLTAIKPSKITSNNMAITDEDMALNNFEKQLG